MSPVEQCRACGRLFPFLARGWCADCLETKEREFRAVRDHLRTHPGTSIPRLASETGVEEERIVDFVREGRLELSAPGGDDALTCELCGRPSNARQCDECRSRFLTAFGPAAEAVAHRHAPAAGAARVSGMKSRHERRTP
jgi:hypothetical protein